MPVAVGAVALVLFTGGGGTAKAAGDRHPKTCNGFAALCDRPLNEVAFAATHNSMSSAHRRGWFFANQDGGIAEQLKGKTKPNALARVAQVLAAGEVELAIAGIPTLLSVKGVQIVGVLPGELQSWFVNTGGVSAAAKEPDAAKALIKYLATPEAAAVITAKGMEVPLSR